MSDYSNRPDHLLSLDLLVEALGSDDEPLHEIALEFSRRIQFDLVKRLILEVAYTRRPTGQRVKFLEAVSQLGGLTSPDHFSDLSFVHAVDKSATVKSEAWRLLSDRPDLAEAHGRNLLEAVAGPAANG